MNTIGLALSLIACGTEWSAVDFDGDGIPFDQDCNDADEAVGPEVAEIWYDGIDQNCDGNDADQDGDGFIPDSYVAEHADWQDFPLHLAAGDCWDQPGTPPSGYVVAPGEGWTQPTADLVFPGAADLWYDAVDQDCAGNDDMDQDGDGYKTSKYPDASGAYGDDCVDGSERDDAQVFECGNEEATTLTPAEINPAATDTWKDGVDTDCSGNNDYDVDGDTYLWCNDCDDNDPAKYPDPSVTEVFYDCLDQNCDGNDADQDGDGYVPAGYAADCAATWAAEGLSAADFSAHFKGEGDCWDDTGSTPTEYKPLTGYSAVPAKDVHPGATDISYDGIDADCATDSDFDDDGDTYDSADHKQRDGSLGTDCDDSDNQVNPGVNESCSTDYDDDCDGGTNDPNASGCTTYYTDSDGDGQGVNPSSCLCDTSGVYTSTAKTDCDDKDADTYVGTAEKETDGATACYNDDDNDGYGDTTAPAGGSGVSAGKAGTDCDDASASDYPGATETANNDDDEDCDGVDSCYLDSDKDGYGNSSGTLIDDDGDNNCDEKGSKEADDTNDCDDANAYTFPGSAEKDSTTKCNNDDDQDGYGDVTVSGSVQAGTDCDDSSATDYPGATETPDDNDDEDCDGVDSCYVDSDKDGYGTTAGTLVDDDGDNNCDEKSIGEADDKTDCDDASATDYPGATETPDDNDDEDCDGYDSCYKDADGDGYGTTAGTLVDDDGDLNCNEPSVGEADDKTDCDDATSKTYPGIASKDSTTSCMNDDDGDLYGDKTVTGSVTAGTDCDDSSSSDYPGATETPDDNDDEDCDGYDSCYKDADGDGFGTTAGTLVDDDGDLNCNEPTIGEADDKTDCDDADADTFVGSAASEKTTSCTNDDDNDGYGDKTVTGTVVAGTDCDDASATDYPGATETPDDNDDEDCDGYDSCYKDNDGDGFGTTAGTLVDDDGDLNCNEPTIGEADDKTDCDDSDADTFVGSAASELTTSCTNDDDNDGYGDKTVTGTVVAGTDCDDASSSDYPGATETYNNGDDENCDGYESCYTDADADTYGTSTEKLSSDTDCTDSGEANDTQDCDDTDADTFPGAASNDSSTSCMNDDDGDNYGDATVSGSVTAGTDCDDSDADTFVGSAALELTTSCTNDDDNDGYGDSTVSALYVEGTDCDDASNSDYPGATETVDNNDDEDCDGVDSCYTDADGDGQGVSTKVDDDGDNNCDEASIGEADDANDCDDSSAATFVGSAASELTTSCTKDSDNDGYGDVTSSSSYVEGTDCDDSNAAISPGDAEVCDDVDQDCDDIVDETCYTGGEFFVSEIHYDSSQSTDAKGEFFEIYNPSATETYYLDGMLVTTGTSTTYTFYIAPGALVIGPQSTAVLCYDDTITFDNVSDPDVVVCDYEYGSNVNGTSSAGVTYNTSAGLTNKTVNSQVKLSIGATTIDTVNYQSFTASGTGGSLELKEDYWTSTGATDNGTDANWCQTNVTGSSTAQYYEPTTGSAREWGTPANDSDVSCDSIAP